MWPYPFLTRRFCEEGGWTRQDAGLPVSIPNRSDVDMRRREFTLRRSKNGEVRVVAMTPTVHQGFGELWKERRLDTNRVFLYNDKPVQRIGTALRRPVVGHCSNT